MLKTDNFSIKLVESDKTFLINNEIAIIKNICKDSQKIFVMYQKFDKKKLIFLSIHLILVF